MKSIEINREQRKIRIKFNNKFYSQKTLSETIKEITYFVGTMEEVPRNIISIILH